MADRIANPEGDAESSLVLRMKDSGFGAEGLEFVVWVQGLGASLRSMPETPLTTCFPEKAAVASF